MDDDDDDYGDEIEIGKAERARYARAGARRGQTPGLEPHTSRAELGGS